MPLISVQISENLPALLLPLNLEKQFNRSPPARIANFPATAQHIPQIVVLQPQQFLQQYSLFRPHGVAVTQPVTFEQQIEFQQRAP